MAATHSEGSGRHPQPPLVPQPSSPWAAAQSPGHCGMPSVPHRAAVCLLSAGSGELPP